MIKGKKGALELSVNTIVVIVIGVTLLTLGLLFVRGLFGKITDLSGDIFDTAEASIGDIGHTGTYNSPTSITIEQGRKKTFNIFVSHDGSAGAGPKTFTLTLTPNGNFEDDVISKIISPSSVTLNEGKESTFIIQVIATADAPLTLDASYQTKVECIGCTGTYATGGFSIEVVKSSGLFG
ncbi:MAG: hypothetical protein AABX55_02980 [Nanoarchaeota archaeon]